MSRAIVQPSLNADGGNVNGSSEDEELAKDKVEHVLLLVAFDREQAIAASRHRLAQRLGAGGEQLADRRALDQVAATQEIARRQVAEHDPPARVAQQHRDRRVLHHGIEQERADQVARIGRRSRSAPRRQRADVAQRGVAIEHGE